MLNLKSGHNVIALTLSEMNAPENGSFILKLTSKSIHKTFVITISDTSPHPMRYNKFSFNVGNELAPGQYDYSVFSTGSPAIVYETGLAVIEGLVISNPVKSYSSNEPVIKTFIG